MQNGSGFTLHRPPAIPIAPLQCRTGPSEFRVGVTGRFQNAMTLVPLARANDIKLSGERSESAARC